MAFGNPSSGHWASTPAKAALEQARGQVAALLGSAPEEIVFTSGGSEANNLAIKGTFFALKQHKGAHIITTAGRASRCSCSLPSFSSGWAVLSLTLPVDRTGRADPEDVRRAITPQTILISVMHANNEVGTIQPIEEIGALAREHGIRFHTDAAQSVGKIPTKVDKLGVDLLTIAGHKLYAPKGVGALYVRRGVELEPIIHGAGHEAGPARRNGERTARCRARHGLRIGRRPCTDGAYPGPARSLLGGAARSQFGDRVVLNGHATQRLPNTLNVSFVGQVGADILGQLDGVAASTGSACHSGRIELSPVLAAMSIPERVGMGAIRFSLGRGTTSDEIDQVIARLARIASA